MSTLAPLKPMTAGDILDQAIRIYRQNFIPLVTIVAIVTVPVLLIQALSIGLVLPLTGDFTTAPELDPSSMFAFLGVSGIASFVGAFFALFELGALTFFVSERFMGRPVTVRQAYGQAFRRWLPLLLAALLLGIVIVGLSSILIGVGLIPLIGATALGSGSDASSAFAGIGVLCLCALLIPTILSVMYFYTRWVFWVQAIMIENYNSTGALGRSWKLVRGSFWRVLAFILLLAVLVYALSFGVVGALSLVAFFLPSPLLQFLVQSAFGAVLGVIIAPLQYATLTVLYYDLRIRKEGFDLQMQMQAPPQDFPSLIPGSSA